MTDPQHVANAVDGLKLEAPEEADLLACDYCSSVIRDGDIVSVYVTDLNLIGDDEYELYPCRVYGECCDRAEVRVPCARAEEFIVVGDASYEDTPTFTNTTTIRRSPRGHGIDWDPYRVFSEFTGLNLRDQVKDSSDTFGPEDVVDMLSLGGVDVRSMLNDDGTIAVSKSSRLQMQEEVLERLSKRFG